MDSGEARPRYPFIRANPRARKSKQGKNDPTTLITQSNLAEAYKCAGKLEEAILLYQQTLKAQTETLGPNHLFTLWTMSGLAKAFEAAGKFNQAIPLHKVAVDSLTSMLGETILARSTARCV